MVQDDGAVARLLPADCLAIEEIGAAGVYNQYHQTHQLVYTWACAALVDKGIVINLRSVMKIGNLILFGYSLSLECSESIESKGVASLSIARKEIEKL